MSEEGFKEHVEALATKRLEKPKKLSARNGRYWSEILSQHYNFHRDQLEVRHSLLGVGDTGQILSQH
jgi:insulysin